MPRLFVLVIAATLLASCAAHGNIGDYIPHWAGGLPEGTPPRPGTPEYDAFRQKQDAEAARDKSKDPPSEKHSADAIKRPIPKITAALNGHPQQRPGRTASRLLLGVWHGCGGTRLRTRRWPTAPTD